MGYEEFCEEFKQKLLGKAEEYGITPEYIKYYADGYAPAMDDTEDLMFVRETNIKYHKCESDILIGDFVVIEDGEENPQIVRLAMQFLYKCCCEHGWEFVWKNVKENLDVCKVVRESGVMENVQNYEVIKDKLILRPLNYNDHRTELKNIIYKKIGDIILVLYILAYDQRDGEQHNVGSVKVQKSLLECWGVSEEELWETAMGNSYMIAPPRMYMDPMDTYKPAYTKGAFMALGNKTTISPAQVPTVTTTMQINGAIAMFYPGVKERIAEMIGGDYLVAFTSISEARIHKCGTINPIEALRRVKGMNKMIPADEVLTRKIFMYECATGAFKQLEL